MMNPRKGLLDFILKKKIPLRLAIDILEKAEEEILAKRKAKEKTILPKYEMR